MFCKNCGTEMNDTARFCPKCGYDRTGEGAPAKREIVEDNRIRFQLKPKFNLPYKIITILRRSLLYLFIIYLFFFKSLRELWAMYPVTFLITIGIMLLYIVIKLILDKKQYDDLEYNFYATKVEYKDGFINKEEKELKYKYVREVAMHQNILERMFGIGTISIFTNAETGFGSGIYIHCVEDVQQQYQTIKQIIDDGTPKNY